MHRCQQHSSARGRRRGNQARTHLSRAVCINAHTLVKRTWGRFHSLSFQFPACDYSCTAATQGNLQYLIRSVQHYSLELPQISLGILFLLCVQTSWHLRLHNSGVFHVLLPSLRRSKPLLPPRRSGEIDSPWLFGPLWVRVGQKGP